MTERVTPFIPEKPVTPEREWEFIDTAVITLSSSPGGGTSSVASLLAENLGITGDSLFKVGDKRREWDKEATGKEHTEETDRNDPLIERKTDAITRSVIRHASSENPAIVEAQLGGFIAFSVEDQVKRNHKKMERNVKILLTVDETIGAQRVKEREEAKGRVGFSVEDWIKINNKRHLKDLKNWRRAYPELRRIDPHDANSLESDGKTPTWKRFYDLKIDTSNATQEQIVNQILITLWENGNIRKVKPNLDTKKN